MVKVSIIIPVYNSESTLERCLDSAIKQTYKNIEIICINDGSSDGSLDILKRYSKKDKRIILIDKKNGGVSRARNDGIRKATGDYVTFVDADDYIEATQIEEMYNAILKNNVDVVRSNYRVFYKNSDRIDEGDLSKISNKKLKNKQIKDIFLSKVLDGSLPCFVYLIMIKKEILDNEKIFFREDIHMMEDVIFYIELINKIHSIYVLDKALYNIYFNEFGATNNVKNYERNIFNVVLVNKYIKDILKKNKLDSIENVSSLNVANVNAIADFIFKHYLAGLDAILVCKKLAVDENMQDILDNIEYSRIDIARRIIILCIKNKQFKILKIYFGLRKIIFKIRH